MDRKYGHRGYRDAEKQEKHEKRDRDRKPPQGGPRGATGPSRSTHTEDGGNGNARAMFELRRGPRGGVRSWREMSKMQFRVALL